MTKLVTLGSEGLTIFRCLITLYPPLFPPNSCDVGLQFQLLILLWTNEFMNYDLIFLNEDEIWYNLPISNPLIRFKVHEEKTKYTKKTTQWLPCDIQFDVQILEGQQVATNESLKPFAWFWRNIFLLILKLQFFNLTSIILKQSSEADTSTKYAWSFISCPL